MKLEARQLSLPFVQTFSHAAASRSTSSSLWLQLTDEEGRSGFGEGCPRSYVTGESMQELLDAARALPMVSLPDAVEELPAWLDRLLPSIDAEKHGEYLWTELDQYDERETAEVSR